MVGTQWPPTSAPSAAPRLRHGHADRCAHALAFKGSIGSLSLSTPRNFFCKRDVVRLPAAQLANEVGVRSTAAVAPSLGPSDHDTNARSRHKQKFVAFFPPPLYLISCVCLPFNSSSRAAVEETATDNEEQPCNKPIRYQHECRAGSFSRTTASSSAFSLDLGKDQDGFANRQWSFWSLSRTISLTRCYTRSIEQASSSVMARRLPSTTNR